MLNSRYKFHSIISESLTVNTRVRQGDAQYSVTLNNALVSVVRGILQSEPQGLNIGQEKQKALAAYADDIVISCNSRYRG